MNKSSETKKNSSDIQKLLQTKNNNSKQNEQSEIVANVEKRIVIKKWQHTTLRLFIAIIGAAVFAYGLSRLVEYF